MNSTTLLACLKLLDKMGRPIISMERGPMLWGKPIRIDENVSNIGLNNIPVLAGDFSYWLTRVCPATAYLQIYQEASGLVERGLYAIRLFCREGGCLMYNDTGSTSQIWGVMNASS